MRKWILSAFTLIIFAIATAQTTATDRIVLLNKQTHDGLVLEQVPGERLVFYRTQQKDTLNIQMDEIERIIRLMPEAEPQKEKTKKKSTSDNFFQGYNSTYTYGMIHYVRGGGDYAIQGFGMSFGTNIDFGLQIGVGAHYMSGESVEGQMTPNRQKVPLGLDVRYLIKSSRNGRFSTMLALSGGYCFTLNGSYFDTNRQADLRIGNGYFFNPGIAFRANLSRNVGLMFDIGYLYNNANLFDQLSGDAINKLVWHNLILRGTFFF